MKSGTETEQEMWNTYKIACRSHPESIPIGHCVTLPLLKKNILAIILTDCKWKSASLLKVCCLLNEEKGQRGEESPVSDTLGGAVPAAGAAAFALVELLEPVKESDAVHPHV